MKIKYLILVDLLKKTDLSELEKKLTGHNHDNYITTPEFNSLANDAFNASKFNNKDKFW